MTVFLSFERIQGFEGLHNYPEEKIHFNFRLRKKTQTKQFNIILFINMPDSYRNLKIQTQNLFIGSLPAFNLRSADAESEKTGLWINYSINQSTAEKIYTY